MAKRKFFLELGGIEYQVSKKPEVGDLIIFTAVGFVKELEVEKGKVLGKGVLTDAIMDAIPFRPLIEESGEVF